MTLLLSDAKVAEHAATWLLLGVVATCKQQQWHVGVTYQRQPSPLTIHTHSLTQPTPPTLLAPTHAANPDLPIASLPPSIPCPIHSIPACIHRPFLISLLKDPVPPDLELTRKSFDNQMHNQMRAAQQRHTCGIQGHGNCCVAEQVLLPLLLHKNYHDLDHRHVATGAAVYSWSRVAMQPSSKRPSCKQPSCKQPSCKRLSSDRQGWQLTQHMCDMIQLLPHAFA